MTIDRDAVVPPKADSDSRARTHLANERTFLAWFRTGLGLVVVGIGSAQFISEDRRLIPGIPVVAGFSAVLITMGFASVAIGAARFVRGAHAIDAGAYRPVFWPIVLASVLALIIGLLSFGLVLLLRGD